MTQDSPAGAGDSYPLARDAVYETSRPNSQVLLYTGRAVLSFEGQEFPFEDCHIKLAWLPTPRVLFEGTFGSIGLKEYPLIWGDGKLKIEGRSGQLGVCITESNFHISGSQATLLRGILADPDPLFSVERLDEMTFHIANFVSYNGDIVAVPDRSISSRSRLTLRSKKWLAEIDQIGNIADRLKQLRAEGGFALTHVGSLRRQDGEPFGVKEAGFIREALYFFLSFVRGVWCGPMLSVTVGESDGLNESWEVPRLTAWKEVQSWFPTVHPVKLDEAFDGFMSRWESSVWREPIKQAIHWYVEANIGAGGVEGSIVLVQTALELLGWVRAVEDPQTRRLSAEGYDGLRSADKLRLLLLELQLPDNIPESLTSLKSLMEKECERDAFSAFTNMRNRIVHPKIKHRKALDKMGIEARIEAHNLGLWYLELVILNTLGYNGIYYSRLRSGFPNSRNETVPW